MTQNKGYYASKEYQALRKQWALDLEIKIILLKKKKRITHDEIDKIIVGFGVNSLNRFQYALRLLSFLRGKNYWYVLRNGYEGSDDLFDHRHEIKKAFLSKEPFRKTLMSKRERDYLQGLPDRITIYRGMTENELQQKSFGCSWSLKKERAEFFAHTYGRNFSTKHLKKVVHQITIDKRDVIAYFDGRNEFEIIYLG